MKQERRKIMKKFAGIVLIGILSFGLAACGKNNDAQGNTDGSQTETQENETFRDDADMEELKNAVVEALGENYWPDTVMDEEMMQQMFGISADLYDDFFCESPMISTNVDTLLIIRAKEGQVQAAEDALNAYRDNQIENGMNYPMNLGKIHGSKVEAIGNYVCFVQLGADTSSVDEQGDEAVIEFCQKENDKALDAIRTVLTK